MPAEGQGNNTPAKAGLGKRTKLAFKRFFGMKVSNNATTQTKKNSNKTQVFNTSKPATPPQVIHTTPHHNPFTNTKPASPAEERITLFNTYEFVITDAGTDNFTVVINSLDKDGNVELANISAQDLTHEKLSELPRDRHETQLVTQLKALKARFPKKEGDSYKYKLHLTAVDDIKMNVGKLNMYVNPGENHGITTPIGSPENPNIVKTLGTNKDKENKRPGLRSRATMRIKKARNVLYSGVRRAKQTVKRVFVDNFVKAFTTLYTYFNKPKYQKGAQQQTTTQQQNVFSSSIHRITPARADLNPVPKIQQSITTNHMLEIKYGYNEQNPEIQAFYNDPDSYSNQQLISFNTLGKGLIHEIKTECNLSDDNIPQELTSIINELMSLFNISGKGTFFNKPNSGITDLAAKIGALTTFINHNSTSRV